MSPKKKQLGGCPGAFLFAGLAVPYLGALHCWQRLTQKHTPPELLLPAVLYTAFPNGWERLAVEGDKFHWADDEIMKAIMLEGYEVTTTNLTAVSERELFMAEYGAAILSTRLAYLEKKMTWGWKRKMSIWNNFVAAVGQPHLYKQRKCRYSLDWVGSLEPLLVPRLKLAFCYIPKVACTAFKDLFNTLNNLSSEVGFGRSYTDSMAYNLRFNNKEVSKENGWTFAAFTRDPLDRYLSAWGSCCVQKEDGHADHPMECCGSVQAREASVEMLVRQFGMRAAYDVRNGLPWEEQHWASQVQTLQNCEWGKFAPDRLDYRGDLSKGGMNEQVHEMMQLVTKDTADLALVDRFFPKKKGAQANRNPILADKAQFYADPQVRADVRKVYAADYELLPDVAKYTKWP